MDLDLPKASGPNYIPVVVLKKCQLEFSYILAELFNKWKVSSVVPVFKNVGEMSTARLPC